MSSKQGPRAAGMRTSANDAGHRQARSQLSADWGGGGVMSSKQGPRAAGMRTSANDAGHRQARSQSPAGWGGGGVMSSKQVYINVGWAKRGVPTSSAHGGHAATSLLPALHKYRSEWCSEVAS
ncbi:MAG: hypothetical protein Kow0096_03320 [Thiohalomonadaceae bacterium]